MSANPHDLLDTFLKADNTNGLPSALAGCVDIDRKDDNGLAPIQRCVRAGRADLVAAFLSAGADPQAALAEAILERSTAILLLLRDLGVAPGDDILLRLRESPSRQIACEKVCLALSVFPELAHCEAVWPEGSMLNYAIEHYYSPFFVQRLLEAGASTESRDAFGRTPLHRALHFGKLDAAVAICCAGCDLEARDTAGVPAFRTTDEHGRTLVHAVASSMFDSRAPDLVRKCLDLGLDANSRDKSGATPIEYAIEAENRAAFLALLESGVNIPDALADDEHPMQALLKFCSETDLVELAQQGHLDFTSGLLEHATQEDQLTPFPADGQTEWRLAANARITLLLLRHGADPLERNCYGDLALAPFFGSTEDEVLRTVRRLVPLAKVRGGSTKHAHRGGLLPADQE